MEPNLIRILDIDLDFFIHPTDWPEYMDDRNENMLQSWSDIDVQSFLERNCGLSKRTPVKGQVFEEHHEVYHYCKNIIKGNNKETQFIIDHVDAHADLGFSWNNSVNLLHKEVSPTAERGWITKELELKIGLNRGNFLLFLIAQGWVFELNYINHATWNFHDIYKNLIFKQDARCDQIRVLYYPDCEFLNAKDQGEGLSINSMSCNFYKIDYRLFNNPHTYDYVFLTKSPNYSPTSSDALIPVIEQYMQV